ncbi:MAG TPA: hypothetical protein VK726_05825 [Acetobacteraceae bacterium]|jgi:hypothetical protein|nr:hypothetical protein [Acetobacteraceae bacterium]
MSATSFDGSYGSGHNHLWPTVVAIVLSAAFIVATVYLAGLPHELHRTAIGRLPRLAGVV